MTRLLVRTIVLLALSLICWTPATAQTSGATVAGTVTDDTGSVLPGATVTATNVATGLSRSATSDMAGRYTVLGLPPGTYDVRVELPAFITVLQRAQQLQVGQTVTLDHRMKLGALSETVEVTAETPVVQTESNTLATILRTDQVDALPSLNRNFTELAASAPGVTVAGNNVTIGNGPTVGTGFWVDGSSLQEPTVGGAAFQVVQDWIQEFSVLTSQLPAEYGAAQNGIINAVTRSGSNRLLGRFSSFFQDDALNSKLWRATTKTPLSQQRIGAQVGGPIRKDSIFYFVGYERSHTITNVPVSISPFFVGVVPDVVLNSTGTQAVGSVEVEPTIHSTIAKIDIRRGNAHTFTPRLLLVKQDNSANGSTTATNVPLTASRQAVDQLNDSYQLGWTWVRSSAALLDSRIAYRRLGTLTDCHAARLKGTPFQLTLTTLTNPALAYPSGGPTLGCTGPWGERGEREFSINETYTQTTHGHTWKAGGMIMRATHFGYEHQNQAGQYSMGRLALFDVADATTYPLGYSINFAPGANPYWEIGGPQYAAFAQDTWRLGTLTLNLGLRWDAEAKLPSTNDYVDRMKEPYSTSLNHVNTAYANVAPRLGFTWAPLESNRLAVRGGLGVFYDESHNGTLAGWAGQVGNTLADGGLVMNVQANSPVLNPYCLGNTRCAAGVPADLQTALRRVMAFALLNNTYPNLTATSVTIGGTTTALPGVAVSPVPLSVGHIDESIKTPYVRQETIGVQMDLGRGLSAAVDLKFVQGRDQYILRNVNINPQGQVIDPVFQSRLQLGNGGELDVKQLLVDTAYRSRRGDSLQLGYALGWAKSNSINNFGNGVGGTPATNPFDYSVDYGPTSNDIRHILNVNGNLEIWKGLAFAPIFRAQSGIPVNPTSIGRPSAAQGCQVYYSQCNAFNTTTGQVVGRNSFRGEMNWTLSARLSKRVALGGRRSITGMLEAYNLTNRVNISAYNGNVGTTGLVADLSAIVPNAAQTMRQVQLGVRLEF